MGLYFIADYDRKGMRSDELRYFFQSDIQIFCSPDGHGNVLFVADNSISSP